MGGPRTHDRPGRSEGAFRKPPDRLREGHLLRPAVLAAFARLVACPAEPTLDDPVLGARKRAFDEVFDGRPVAHGRFQDVLGTVRWRFVVDILGDWDGGRLKLTEDLVCEDRSTERRVRTPTRTGPDGSTRIAPGVVGTATGVESGDRFDRRYTMDLPNPSADGAAQAMRVSFDERM